MLTVNLSRVDWLFTLPAKISLAPTGFSSTASTAMSRCMFTGNVRKWYVSSGWSRSSLLEIAASRSES
jgi:hypothetical protein